MRVALPPLLVLIFIYLFFLFLFFVFCFFLFLLCCFSQTNKNKKSCWFVFTATMQHTNLHFHFLILYLSFSRWYFCPLWVWQGSPSPFVPAFSFFSHTLYLSIFSSASSLFHLIISSSLSSHHLPICNLLPFPIAALLVSLKVFGIVAIFLWFSDRDYVSYI